jgi:hypothetical protein
VTHDHLRTLIPRYAAGELEGSEAETMRAHLATGCSECLADLFRRPVGRVIEVVAPVPAPKLKPRTPPPPRNGVIAALTATAAVMTFLLAAWVTWTVRDLHAREQSARIEAARNTAHATELEAARDRLTDRVSHVEAELAAAQAELGKQRETLRVTADTNEQLERDLAMARERSATLTRGVQRRDLEIDRLLTGVDEAHALQELMASPGVALLRLEPRHPYTNVRGHVLWHPAREVFLLYAFDLPALVEGFTYRVRFAMADGTSKPGPTFKPSAHGQAVLPVRLDGEPGRLREVNVVREPGDEVLLAGANGNGH